MKNLLLAIIAVFVLIATNPSLEKHRERIRAAVAEQAEKEATGVSGTFVRLFGLTDLAASLAVKGVSRANFIVCSFGMYDDKVISFGALGCVILVK